MVILFVLTSFLTASLLFVVQPMVGRMVLPAFGGSPQVWTTSMLFFQVALLLGYGYTHLTTTRLSSRAQPWVHLVVAFVPLVLLPIGLVVAPSGAGGLAPSIELLGALTVGVAGPFVLIATSGPLVQRWFSWTDHPRSHDPYFLYAAGNIGSAVGLLAYPFVLEPVLTIEQQSLLWAGGYVVALVLLAACALVVRARGSSAGQVPVNTTSGSAGVLPRVGADASNGSIGARRIGRWLLLAFIPSSLMLAVTTVITTDIAAVPLLWIAPLGIYLLTFTVAFSTAGPRALRWATLAAPVTVVAAIAIRPAGSPVLLSLAVQVLLVFVGGIVAHGQLAADRPPPAQLTRFYLVVAVGGALGGFFNSLVAPLIFPTVLEYGVTVALLLGLFVFWRQPVRDADNWSPTLRVGTSFGLVLLPFVLFVLLGTDLWGAPFVLRGAVAVLVAIPLITSIGASAAVGLSAVFLVLLPQLLPLMNSVLVERTFFGVHRVDWEDDTLRLLHGTTVHGTQDFSSPEARLRPISYYHPEQPFGQVMDLIDSDAEIGVLGLGAGGIAAHGEPGQRYVFHEIDPAVVEIASAPFTFLSDTPAEVDIVLGDGRLTLDGVEGQYDLLVMDAFTSDAVPVHLLTVEAMDTYLDALAADGLIAVNISNRYLDLLPVVAAAASELGLAGVYAIGDGQSDGSTPSQWALLAREPAAVATLLADGWQTMPSEGVLWTDQRSSLWQVVIR